MVVPPLAATNQPLNVCPLRVGLNAGAVRDSPEMNVPEVIEFPPCESNETEKTSLGITVFEAVEESEIPALFVAVTVNVSELFGVNPET